MCARSCKAMCQRAQLGRRGSRAVMVRAAKLARKAHRGQQEKIRRCRGHKVQGATKEVMGYPASPATMGRMEGMGKIRRCRGHRGLLVFKGCAALPERPLTFMLGLKKLLLRTKKFWQRVRACLP